METKECPNELTVLSCKIFLKDFYQYLIEYNQEYQIKISTVFLNDESRGMNLVP